MKHLMLDVTPEQDRRLYEIRRGMMAGCKLYLSRNDRFPLQAGTFEREVSSRFAELARGSRLFLDIGAAEGFFSIYMLRNTRAKVFAFENGYDFGDILLQNIERNTRNRDRVVFEDRLIGRSGLSREAMTVDRTVAGQEGPVLIKIDTEGEELDILKSAREVLAWENTRVIVRIYDKPTELRCRQLLEQNGFEVEFIGAAWWRNFVSDRNDNSTNRWLIAEKTHADGLPS